MSPDQTKELEEKVVDILRRGGVVIYPTETCYGIGVDPTNEAAADKLWRFKGGRGDKPVLIAVSGVEMAGRYGEPTNLFKKVSEKYWPGPVSLVILSKKNLVSKVLGGKETVGFRMPDMALMLSIISHFGKPITSTSANVSGGDNPYSLEQFLENTPKDRLELIDLFIDAGQIPERKPSTVADVTGEEIKILRQGEVTIEV